MSDEKITLEDLERMTREAEEIEKRMTEREAQGLSHI